MSYTIRYYYRKEDGLFSNGKDEISEHLTNVQDRTLDKPCSEDSSIMPYKKTVINYFEEEAEE